MAIALVKAGTVASSTSGTVSPTFGQATGSGNLLIAWVSETNATTTIATSASGWSVVQDRAGGAAIAYKPNSAAGETAPAFTGVNDGLTILYAALAEFSGAATSSPLDQQGAKQTISSTPALAVCAAADVASGELLVSCTGHALTKAGTTTTTDTYNNGATPTTNLNNDATSTPYHYRYAWGTTTGNSAASQDSSADTSMNLSVIDALVVTFKLPSAASLFAQPCNLGNSPGLLVEAWKSRARSWRKKRNGIFVPDLWLPGPAVA